MPGWNPVSGHDPTGTRPTGSPYGYVQTADQPFIPHGGGPGQTFAMGQYGYAYPVVAQGHIAANAYGPQYSYMHQPNGTGSFIARHAQGTPHIDSNVPALNFTNSTGGVGCEPGYNYWFSPANTKLHFFQSKTAPWHLPSNAQIPFKALHVPVNITFAELFKGTGCTNPKPKKNRVYEVISAGGGRWYKGLEVTGDDKDMLKKPIRDVGWDETRTGLPGEKPAVCLWVCKD